YDLERIQHGRIAPALRLGYDAQDAVTLIHLPAVVNTTTDHDTVTQHQVAIRSTDVDHLKRRNLSIGLLVVDWIVRSDVVCDDIVRRAIVHHVIEGNIIVRRLVWRSFRLRRPGVDGHHARGSNRGARIS